VTWNSVGDDGAVRGWILLAPLPYCGGVVFCCVRCLRAFVCVVVVFASARYVQCFLLYDAALLLPFISKKEKK